MYFPSRTSLENLRGVHPSLAACTLLAMANSEHDFRVAEGLRTIARQERLVSEGRSKTLRSKHLPQEDGWGHAVDLYPVGYKSVSEIPEVAWEMVATAMRKAAFDLGVNLTWGNDWDGDGIPIALDPDEGFVDKPHWQLRR